MTPRRPLLDRKPRKAVPLATFTGTIRGVDMFGAVVSRFDVSGSLYGVMNRLTVADALDYDTARAVALALEDE